MHAFIWCMPCWLKKLIYEPKPIQGVMRLFNLHIVKAGLINKAETSVYQLIFDTRNEADYEDFAILQAEDVLPLISQAEEFIKTIQKLIL